PAFAANPAQPPPHGGGDKNPIPSPPLYRRSSSAERDRRRPCHRRLIWLRGSNADRAFDLSAGPASHRDATKMVWCWRRLGALSQRPQVVAFAFPNRNAGRIWRYHWGFRNVGITSGLPPTFSSMVGVSLARTNCEQLPEFDIRLKSISKHRRLKHGRCLFCFDRE